MRRPICLLLCILCLAAVPALSEKNVTIEDLKYGSDAFELHRADQPNTFTCDGITYQLKDKWFAFEPAVELWGGKTRAVYEHTVPQNVLTEFADKACVLGTITISPAVKTTLIVGEGNRLSGEFTLSDPVELTDPYTEEISLPRNGAGKPVLIDKIYLYSFEENGETQHYAATFYVDYDGIKASHSTTVSGDPQSEVPADDPLPAVSKEPADDPLPAAEDKKTSSWLFVIPGAVLITALCLLLARKKNVRPAQTASVEKSSDDLAELEALAAVVKDETVLSDLRGFIDLCHQIRRAVQQKPRKEAQTHKFFGYYVPTVKRLVSHLVTTEQRTTQHDEMVRAHDTVRSGVSMARKAAEKQLENMYRREQMDADADIAVMKNMLKMDGFSDEPSPFHLNSEKK